MQYMGGKGRLAKKFAPILREAVGDGGSFYEPFVGGFNVVEHVPLAGRVVCNDIHRGLICMYRGLQMGTFNPPMVMSEERYRGLRVADDQEDPMTAFAAFGCSFAAMEWRGYARDGKGRNYCGQASRSLVKKSAFMDGVEFTCGDYRDVPLIPDVIYADPPYEGTTKYRGAAGVFDHQLFKDWCEFMVGQGSRVFVSEFSLVDGWDVAWSLERKVTIRKDSRYATKVDYLMEVRS